MLFHFTTTNIIYISFIFFKKLYISTANKLCNIVDFFIKKNVRKNMTNIIYEQILHVDEYDKLYYNIKKASNICKKYEIKIDKIYKHIVYSDNTMTHSIINDIFQNNIACIFIYSKINDINNYKLIAHVASKFNIRIIFFVSY